MLRCLAGPIAACLITLAIPAALAQAPLPPAQPAPAGPAAPPADAEGKQDTELVLACKARALSILKQRSPSIEDIFIDMDGITVAKADLSVEDTKVRTVIMGEAYIQRDKSDKVHRFLCLTGEDGKVLLTFFTER